MATRHRITRTVTAAALAAALAGGLVACGGGDNTAASPAGAPAEAPAADASFNAADVSFVQQMIPHHSQAVKMASLAPSRAKDAKVKKLAAEILAGQGTEIETMQGFLETWDQPLVGDMAGMDHSSMSPEEMAAMTPGSMPGMASDTELTALSAAKGATFDRLFLTMMLEHHQGALEMAAAEQADGRDPQATALAEEIETTQTGEIARIEKLQGT